MDRLLYAAALAAVLLGGSGCLGPLTPSRASRYVETNSPVIRVEGGTNITLNISIEKGDGMLTDTSGGGDSNTASQNVSPTTTLSVPQGAGSWGGLVDGVLRLFGRGGQAAAQNCPDGQCSDTAPAGCPDGQCSEAPCAGGVCR